MSAAEDIHAEVARLVAAGDAAGVISRLKSLPPRRFTPSLISQLSVAAMQTGSTAAARQAATLSISAELPLQERARIAKRLAMPALGVPELAWLVLSSDPAAMLEPAALDDTTRALGMIAEAEDPSLRAAAGAALRRLLRVAPSDYEELPPEPRTSEAPPPAPSDWLDLICAPDLPPDAERQFREMAVDFERQLANPVPPWTRLLRNVFVNANGQVWRADGRPLVDGLANGWPAAVPPTSLAAMPDAPRLAEAEFAALRPSAVNFFHWMVNCLPTLSRYLPAGGMTLLVGQNVPDFVRQSLRLAGGKWTFHPAGDATFVERLFVSWSPVISLAWSENVRLMHERLISCADADKQPDGVGPLLYISRRDSGFRAMQNEAALEERLTKIGFCVITFNGRSLLEQISIVRAARFIVAPHGAGLTHLAFARRGITILELMPLVTALSLRFNMARISRMLGHRHVLWLTPTAEGRYQWSADLDALLPDVERLANKVS
jgi:capsular polysaccharide biosynthesis protein